MRSLIPASIPPQPPLSWRELTLLLLLLPVWLPILAGVAAALVVVGLFVPPDLETGLESTPDDDDLPDDYVPPFVPPPASSSPTPSRLRPASPKASALAEPAPALIVHAVPASGPPAEQPRAEASCWPQSFPAG